MNDLKKLQTALKTRHVMDSYVVEVDGASKDAGTKVSSFATSAKSMVKKTTHDVLLAVVVVK